MIDKKCFTKEWIDKKSTEFGYNDKNLIEKVIRAFSLLDMLASSGCPFFFKGGSCLMLILKDTRHRLSIDIDIMCPPGVNIEDYLEKHSDHGFINYKLIERKQTTANVPKSHSKFFYMLAYNDNEDKQGHILLDVLYEDCHYLQTNKIPIANKFIESVGEPTMVAVPSVADILGDKMTAFAPETTGIPYYKKGELATVEITKQLYDIGRLFDRIKEADKTAVVFHKIAKVEMGYRGMYGDLSPIYNDIRQTALNISTRGYIDKDKFTLLQKGIKNISPFMYKSNYHIEDATADAAKAAYLATLIEFNKTNIEHYINTDSIRNLSLGDVLTTKLNKLKYSNPEAFFYWAKTEEILSEQISLENDYEEIEEEEEVEEEEETTYRGFRR